MNNKYIDKNSYEILKNVFEVDNEIANSISLLNKKRYYTLYSCSGHPTEPVYYKKVYNIGEIEDIGNDSYIVKKDEEKFTLLYRKEINNIYIKFDKNYNFINLPEGFIYDNENNILEHIINIYENNKRREQKSLEEEMINYNKILLNWVTNLPNK